MIPVVTIVGRPNVGKSSLLNALTRRRISIVDPTPGITRDRVSVFLDTHHGAFELVDTGGIGIVDAQHLEGQIEQQIDHAIDTADIILFVVDGRGTITDLDQRITERLRKQEKPVWLLVNKIDVTSLENDASEFHKLGFETFITVSAEQGRNLDLLMEKVGEFLRENEFPEPAPSRQVMKLAMVGKRNAGKSTLINYLAQGERVIVSETPGTTRDAVDIRFELDGQEFIAIDTAGVRKRKAVENSIEFYSQARSIKAIRRADVVMLLIDAREVTSQVDKKLADTIVESDKPIIICVNKWDLAGNVTPAQYMRYIRDRLPALHFAPVTFLSGMTGLNVRESIRVAQELHTQAQTRVGTGQVNKALQEALERRRPPVSSGKKAKSFYATQTDVAPPTIVIFVNDPALFSKEYRRYLTNRFRQTLPYAEIPIKLVFRAREKVELPKKKRK